MTTLKEAAMEHVRHEMELARRYGDGYEDGYADGYDRALADIKKIKAERIDEVLERFRGE